MRARRLLGVCLVAVLTAAACGASESNSTSSRAAGPGGNASGNGALTVFAASSLTEPFTELGTRFEAVHRRARVTFNFGASSALAHQVAGGAPADVVATADEASMETLVAEDLVVAPKVLARNRLAILVAEGNPKSIDSLDDLARPGLALVLCAPEVPCGVLARKVLSRAGVNAAPKSYEANVKAVVSRVTLGEADAGIVYATDVKAAGGKAEGVEVPQAQNLTTSYLVAAREAGPNRRRAEVFIAFLLSDAGQRVLAEAGFESP